MTNEFVGVAEAQNLFVLPIRKWTVSPSNLGPRDIAWFLATDRCAAVARRTSVVDELHDSPEVRGIGYTACSAHRLWQPLVPEPTHGVM